MTHILVVKMMLYILSDFVVKALTNVLKICVIDDENTENPTSTTEVDLSANTAFKGENFKIIRIRDP